MQVQIAGISRESIVDGPGVRFTVFAQGCPHACKGCHNPQTHPSDGGSTVETQKIVAEFAKNPYLSGITFSGGEPLEQAEGMLEIADKIISMGKNIIIYTGYTFEELQPKLNNNSSLKKLLELSYLLVDGRFVLEQRDLNLKMTGSRNQRVLDIQSSLKQNKPILYNDI